MKNEKKGLKLIINQLNCQIAVYKKIPPFNTKYYQKGEGYKSNTNPFKKLSLEECEKIQFKLKNAYKLIKKYHKKILKLENFKYKTELK